MFSLLFLNPCTQDTETVVSHVTFLRIRFGKWDVFLGEGEAYLRGLGRHPDVGVLGIISFKPPKEDLIAFPGEGVNSYILMT